MNLPLWRATSLRRRVFEVLGSTRYSMPAFGEIHSKCANYFSAPGFFVEAGAVDGFFESNTYFLERFMGWRGVLIEPVPSMFRRLAVNRPKAKAFNCALVSPSHRDPTISISGTHATARVTQKEGVFTSVHREAVHSVPARTMTSILDEAGVDRIDLLSLDIEGFEIEALRGLNFDKYLPRFILVECLDERAKAEMDGFLAERYLCIDKLSYRDFLYSAK